MRSAIPTSSGSIGRDEDDRRAQLGTLLHQAVDLALGADVDAARRLREHQHLGVAVEHPPEHDLLLVAARERSDTALRRGGHDVVALDRRAHAPTLRARVHHTGAGQLADPRDCEVLGHAAGGQQPGTLPIVRHEADAARERGARLREVGRPAENAHGALARDRSAQRQAELGLAGADKTSDADDLATADAQRRGTQPAVPRAQLLDLEHRLASRDRALAVVVAQLTPDHPPHELALRCGPQRHLGDDAPVAQHGRRAGDPVELVQPVRDHQHRSTARAELVDDLQQPLRGGLRERARGFVEDQ